MTKFFGLESLIQRGADAFFTDLISVYQKSQEALRDASGASQEDIFFKLKRIGFDVDLKETIEKYTNIPVSMVYIEESSAPNLAAFCTPTKMFQENIVRKNKTSGMMVEEINRFYNDRTGRLETNNRQSSPCKFIIGVNTGLWGVRDKNQDFYFAPDELAAATLHEVGHIDHFIRSIGRAYSTTQDAADIIDYISTTPDKDTILTLLTAIKKSSYLDKSWEKILKTTEAYFRTSNSLDDPSYWEALSALSAAVAADASSRSLSLINVLLERGRTNQVKTRLYVVDAERSADDFAVRHGAYAALVRVIGKHETLATTKYDLYLNQFTGVMAANLFGFLMKFKTAFDVSAEDISNGYDPLIRRLKLMVETGKHSFHDADLPDSVKHEISRQIEEAEQYIHDYESTGHQKIRTSLKLWKDNVAKFGRIISSPVQNRLRMDYEKLQDANRSLTRHSLYYLANK